MNHNPLGRRSARASSSQWRGPGQDSARLRRCGQRLGQLRPRRQHRRHDRPRRASGDHGVGHRAGHRPTAPVVRHLTLPPVSVTDLGCGAADCARLVGCNVAEWLRGLRKRLGDDGPGRCSRPPCCTTWKSYSPCRSRSTDSRWRRFLPPGAFLPPGLGRRSSCSTGRCLEPRSLQWCSGSVVVDPSCPGCCPRLCWPTSSCRTCRPPSRLAATPPGVVTAVLLVLPVTGRYLLLAHSEDLLTGEELRQCLLVGVGLVVIGLPVGLIAADRVTQRSP